MSAVDRFEAERAGLIRLAYRLLGSLAEAEDVAQDTWLRWRRIDPETVDDARAWLARTATRLCLDRLRAARRRRETYVGPWLPEPLVEETPADPLERAEEVSVAVLLALQRLSPLERAVFLLRDVFGEDYAAVAAALSRQEAACRQAASRARSHLQAAKPRFDVPHERAARLAAAFMKAAVEGDTAALSAMLADDCVLISDGGGRRPAALRPLVGRDDILGLIRGLAWRGPWPPPGPVRGARINGLPGLVISSPDGVQTIAFEAAAEDRLSAIYIVRNPEKLTAISAR